MLSGSKCYQSYHEGLSHTRGSKCFYIETKPMLLHLDDRQNYYHIPISFVADCFYDIEFQALVPTDLTLENIELIYLDAQNEPHHLYTFTSSNRVFTGFPDNKPLMLWLLSSYNRANPSHLGILHYRIKYRGKGILSYSCKHGFLSESLRLQYIDLCNQEPYAV